MEQRREERNKKKVGVLVRDLLATNELGLVEVDPYVSKKQKRSESRKIKGIMPLIPEGQVIAVGEDSEALGVGKDEEGLLAPEEVEKEYLEKAVRWTFQPRPLVLNERYPVGVRRLTMVGLVLIHFG